MNKKIYSKLLAVILIITLTFANFLFLAVYAGKSYAASTAYENQGTEVKNTDVSFDAYFISEEGVKSHTKVTEMNNVGLKLFLSVSVSTGYLENATVSILDSNFKLVNVDELPNGVEAIDTVNNNITLNQIHKGENKNIELPIEVIKDEIFNLNNFSKDTQIKLSGTFVNNSAKKIKAEKTIIVNLAISEDATSSLSARIYKYATFKENEKNKALLQVNISSKVENNLLPVKLTKIDMAIPTLFGVKPESISVTSSSTKATNGKDGTSFSKDNYTCTEDMISISVSNEADANNSVAWVKNSTDEYLVNLVYSLEDLETEITVENSKVQLSISSKQTLYNNGEREIEKQVSGELLLPQAGTSVVSYAIANTQDQISKGYMLVKDSADTQYKQEIKVNIGYNPTVNNIEINKNDEYYTDTQGNKYTATTYYKTITINKENLVKILGENGTISIMSNGVNLATLDKEKTSYVFEEEISNIIILTSEPLAAGILTIQTEKYIKSQEYNEQILNNINKLTTSIAGKTTDITEQSSTEIALVQPQLKISSTINNNKLSTVTQNTNVELKVSLQTNNSTNKLFKNPIVEIELPSYVEEVTINPADVLYTTELQKVSQNVLTNNEGNKIIRVELQGEQTKFCDIPSVEGATIRLMANIKVKETAPSITQAVKVRITNNNQETVETSSNISYIAPIGMITLNGISGYNNKQETITSISGKEEVGKIDVASEKRVATQKITIINNYDYRCGNIQILGRTPSQGNKSLSTQDDLGSTFTAKMVSTIKAVSGVDNQNTVIYYSENENATLDLSNEGNGWKTNPKDLSNIKSYLIVLGQTMAKGDKVEFSYDIEIPEGLSRKQNTYSGYQVSYTNVDGRLRGAGEIALSPISGLSTGTGPELKVELSADVKNGQQVREGKLIEYTVKVTNIGESEVNNAQISADIPKNESYTTKEIDSTREIYVKHYDITKYTDTIAKIAKGESIEKKFLLTVGNRIEYKIEEFISREDYSSEEEYQEMIERLGLEKWIQQINDTQVEMVANVVAYDNGEAITFTSNKMVNEKILGYFDLNLERDDASFKEGSEVTYRLTVEKLGVKDITNLEITTDIPSGLTYKSSIYNEEEVTQNITGSKIKWNIEELSRSTEIILRFTIDEIKQDKTISFKVQGTCNEYNGKIESITDTFTVGIPKLEISHSSNNTIGYMTEGDKIVYTIIIENKSNVIAHSVKVTDYLSEGLQLQNYKYTLGNITNEYVLSGNEYSSTIDIPANETLKIEITARANELETSEERTVSNRFEVEAEKISKISSESIEHKVNKKTYVIDDEDKVTQNSLISGLVWLDKNKNGLREEDEEKVAQIPVMLINEQGTIVASTLTGEDGSYTFNNIQTGKYIVVFMYDMANYDVTKYALENTVINSDAVTMNVEINGEQTPCAATNTISLESNLYNIDLGLIENPKFDLSLTKAISKTTLQTSKGTQTKSYNNSTLEKIELASKDLQGATVAIEYTITVKNDGAIAGYATRIVDYLSETDLKFNSETNPDWYLGTDGNIYNSSMKEKLLQPGESVELKLVLTKQVTENNTGLSRNTAEIYESYNDSGLEDYNSTPANKKQNENDLGQADIIIGPKTGVVMYIGFTIILLSITIVAIYILNKKVIKKM